ncbi:MAG: DUF3291 domain-containing protein [Pseudomonadota bacterium]
MHVAEFNIGTLRYDWDDPRVADFQNNLDRVYDIARRSKGYVWHLDGGDMEAAQLDADGPLGGNPRTASTLSVWESVADFRAFTFDTVHRVFMDRGDEWHLPKTGPSLVMWWLEPGTLPTVPEAVERLSHLAAYGETERAFGWEYALAPR